MTYGQLIDELASRLKLNKTDPDTRLVLGRKVNQIYKEIASNSAYNWEHLKRTGEIRTVPNYITGTATTTKDSRTVTFSGATITAAFQGRYFQPSNSSAWYLIQTVSDTSTIILVNPIVEDSLAAGSFIIWKRFYYLPSEARKILEIASWFAPGELLAKSNAFIQDNTSNISRSAQPSEWTIYGTNPYSVSYSTGTVTVSKDSKIMTGAGTAWLGNVFAGDLVIIGDARLRIRSVDSDTQITLLNASNSDFSAQTYEIDADNPVAISFYATPDKAYILPCTYLKRAYDMVNEAKDTTEFPEEFDFAILDGAEASRMRDLDDAKWIAKTQEYKARITDLKASGALSVPRYRQMRVGIVDRGRYGLKVL